MSFRSWPVRAQILTELLTDGFAALNDFLYRARSAAGRTFARLVVNPAVVAVGWLVVHPTFLLQRSRALLGLLAPPSRRGSEVIDEDHAENPQSSPSPWRSVALLSDGCREQGATVEARKRFTIVNAGGARLQLRGTLEARDLAVIANPAGLEIARVRHGDGDVGRQGGRDPGAGRVPDPGGPRAQTGRAAPAPGSLRARAARLGTERAGRRAWRGSRSSISRSDAREPP